MINFQVWKICFLIFLMSQYYVCINQFYVYEIYNSWRCFRYYSLIHSFSYSSTEKIWIFSSRFLVLPCTMVILTDIDTLMIFTVLNQASGCSAWNQWLPFKSVRTAWRGYRRARTQEFKTCPWFCFRQETY